MSENVVLIGAGSVSFTRGLVADMLEAWGDGELRLVDVDPRALEVAEGLARKMIAARGAAFHLSASTDRREMLTDATVVICTVGVGGRRAWEQDVLIPRKYGIFQPVGDSVMPGGSSRALRMIPAMVEIAEDVLELAPDALFFNYGNPMAPVCRAIRKATGAPVVGLCHGVSHTAGYLAEVLSVPPIRFGYTAVGMNHLTWFTEARVDGTDAMPRLRELAEERVARFPEGSLGHRFVEAGTVDGPSADVACPFSWSLFLLFGAFPAVLDRHVVEFFPQFFRDGKFYGKRLGIDSYSFEEVISAGDRAYEEMQRDALSSDALPGDYFARIGGEHEQVVSIIDDMREDSGSTYSVNLPNRGHVPNLPFDAVVEAPAIATAAGLRAISQPPLPAGVAGTLATRMMWVETIVEAAIEGDRDKFVQALVLDGCVQSLDIASAMADELLTAHAQYLPQFG